MHDWPERNGDVPTPTLVAAWLTLDMLPTERVPRWAAYWLTRGYDGTALAELAGLPADASHEIRDVLPAALTDCGVPTPAGAAPSAMEAFTSLAELCLQGIVTEQWILEKTREVVTRSDYAGSVLDLPLARLYGLDDEWGSSWGRGDTELRAVVRQACLAQVRLAESR